MKRHSSSSSSSSSSSTSSLANQKKPSAATKGTAALVRRKKLTNARRPLRDLNAAVSCSNGNNASFSSSTSTSMERPNGCPRFFLSNSSSCAKARAPLSNRLGALPGTPKSYPAPKPKNNSKPSKSVGKSKNCSVSGNLEEGSSKKKQDFELDLCHDNAANCTPNRKITGSSGSGLQLHCRADENNDSNETKIKTPPIETSDSPETQRGGSDVPSTAKMASGKTSLQPCYGAGHVLSGITDKRKCKPRGILTLKDNDSEYNIVCNVFENVDANDDDNESGALGSGKTSGLSPVPLPCEALFHWLSPCREEGEKDQKSNSPTHRLHELVSASLSSSDVLSKCSLSSSATDCRSGNSQRENTAPRHSSRGLVDFWGFFVPANETLSPSHMTLIFSNSTSKDRQECNFYDKRKDNALSTSSFDSGNVIQTPSSSLASKNPGEDQKDSDLNLVAQAFDKVDLSPVHDHQLMWSPANLRNSIDPAQVQNVVDRKLASWVSNSTSDFASSQDPLRISWRDGLGSRNFEMDECDCCRCFSDEEEDSNSKLHHSPEQSSGVVYNTKLEAKQKVEMDSDIQCMSLDSISSDGNLLIASDDSSWNLCYKNNFFQV